MTIIDRQKTVESTPFSDFFRNASSREKSRVYKGVLKRATERQQKVIERAKSKEEYPYFETDGSGHLN